MLRITVAVVIAGSVYYWGFVVRIHSTTCAALCEYDEQQKQSGDSYARH